MKIINLPFDEFTNKGISCYEERNLREAIAFFDKAIRKDNEAVVAYYYRGLSRYELNQYEEAIADFDKVITLISDLASDLDEVYEKRSLVRLARTQYYGALEDCDEAIRINRYNANAFEIRGKVKIKLGDDISGSEDIKKACQLRARWEVNMQINT